MRSWFVLCLLLLTGCMDESGGDRPETELVSHRGLGGTDNTIGAFHKAINRGFTSIEADVRIRDGQVVLAHDPIETGIEYDTLDDLVNFTSNNNIRLWLEPKDPGAIVPTLELLQEYNMTNVVIASIVPEQLDLVKQLSPELETGLILGNVELPETIDYDWVIMERRIIRKHFEAIKHKKIAAWTIKNQGEFNKIRSYIDAAITDVDLWN